MWENMRILVLSNSSCWPVSGCMWGNISTFYILVYFHRQVPSVQYVDAWKNSLPSPLYSIQTFLPLTCKLVPIPTFMARLQMFVSLTGIIHQYVNMPFGAQQVLSALSHWGERCQVQLHHHQLTGSLRIFCIASDVGSSFFGLLQVSACDDNTCTCCTEVSCRISASS